MLSQTFEYALRAMMHLAGLGGEPATSQRIARQTKVPTGYISKVMRDLVVAGLVDSHRGRGGGFTLARPPGCITILDVLDAVDPIKRVRKCPTDNPAHVKLCGFHRRLDGAICQIQSVFGGTTLAALLLEDSLDHGNAAQTLSVPEKVPPEGLEPSTR